MPRLLGFGLLLAALGVAVYASVKAWGAAGDVPIGVHGLVALLLGATFTLLLAGGLVALMLYSRRRGYDEDAADGPDGPRR
ncbi:hypothetical protein [Paracraurococcus ruber]|uniref:Uncharacterized protein n=1 Tax=Paracraurococcus ruber TaxID=77675 RepID=A0ABS1D537_9PROT|nr:hypothetical protein [Paracraurococcus ruber]MBK1661608.1 hypothetical protein [Paracraurococcus ruber]TDG18642.1 hypothetical protein E2C05_28025 [Paracraurococcus ruber]